MPDDTRTTKSPPGAPLSAPLGTPLGAPLGAPLDASYELDLHAWANAQAEALREVGNALERGDDPARLPRLLRPLDWANLAEEIEGLARSDRRELGQRIATVIEHLAKLEHSPAQQPRPGWIITIERNRAEIAEILRDSPSLKRGLPELIEHRRMSALRLAMRALDQHGEVKEPVLTDLQRRAYKVEEIIGDWLPAAPAADRDVTPAPKSRRRLNPGP